MERITLYEELRLIEKSEPEVNGAWKGAHLLLFFLAFVFGSFCTFCFHMLMYLFDEKCVLFPKLLSLTSLRQTIIYEFIPEDKDAADMLPVDFLSTQWVEKSACLLPTYVPLVSGIFGLVWTTMFLMWSTGSRVVTGLQRPWRVLPPVFLFSLAMSGLCLYTSAVTHYGLQELCNKLSEITGSSTCTYTVNVATLAYNRRIRGVYQATRLTIFSAWLHTLCWILSTLLASARVLFAVDFKLVRVSVHLQGNIDRMLEQHERHIRTVLPDTVDSNDPYDQINLTRSKVFFHIKKEGLRSIFPSSKQNISLKDDPGDLLYYSDLPKEPSDPSLMQSERNKLDMISALNAVPTEHQFIVKMLYDVLNTVLSKTYPTELFSSSSSIETLSSTSQTIVRQYGQQRIASTLKPKNQDQSENSSINSKEAEEIALEIKRHLRSKLFTQISEININDRKMDRQTYDSTMNITSDMKTALQEGQRAELKEKSSDYLVPSTSDGKKIKKLKPNLKQAGVQTDEKTRDRALKVQIDSKTSIYTVESDVKTPKENKETQTNKEKQE